MQFCGSHRGQVLVHATPDDFTPGQEHGQVQAQAQEQEQEQEQAAEAGWAAVHPPHFALHAGCISRLKLARQIGGGAGLWFCYACWHAPSLQPSATTAKELVRH